MNALRKQATMLLPLLLLLLFLVVPTPVVQAICPAQSPFYPPPTYDRHASEIWEAFSQIEASLSTLTRNNTTLFDTSSYSVEVTSSHRTLWSTFHTARDKNETRPGAVKVDSTSRYRIASITKVFTVLGILQLHGAGRVSLDDSVAKYVSFSTGTANSHSTANSGSIDWDKITLRTLASQLSGLPRDWAQGDLLTAPDDHTAMGLPPIPASAPERDNLPKCDSYEHYKPCTAHELLAHLQHRVPLFAPGRKSTYSNIAFELLGMVIANVTGMAYEDAITASILHPLGMNETSFVKPPDEVAVLPKHNAWYWDVDEGVQNPTGGLYCSAGDMSIFLRHVLTEYMDAGASKINWLPETSSSAGGSASWYAMPWETFRTEKILGGGDAASPSPPPSRSVTFFTKGGGLPGYTTIIVLVPEFDLGVTIFTAGDVELLGDLIEMITVPLIRAADKLAARQVVDSYVGEYDSFSSQAEEGADSEADASARAGVASLNSSLTLSYTATHGLEITRWISNATDMLGVFRAQFKLPKDRQFHAQLIPTLLYRESSNADRLRDDDQKEMNKGGGKGELWRMVVALDKPTTNPAGLGVWDDFCVADVDTKMYAGRPLNEVIFWDRNASSAMRQFGRVEMSAFRVNLTRVHGSGGGDGGGGGGGGKATTGEDLKLVAQDRRGISVEGRFV
ncbi:beta-lactamase family protein [Cladophialophora carrionii]|uniref:Beta-lactamase family protein n=1 Tax=Cladophialophora carrionii TaxID=86049 RepID=A0A1C1CSN3_9EURO|nr:beta-lactamase family protein [Cladophialophora carrionii]